MNYAIIQSGIFILPPINCAFYIGFNYEKAHIPDSKSVLADSKIRSNYKFLKNRNVEDFSKNIVIKFK